MRLLLVSAAIAVAILAGTVKPRAADAAPDVIGLRPGTGIREAARVLQDHDAKGVLSVGTVSMPQLSDMPMPALLYFRGVADPTEVVQVNVTLPPNEQVAWNVARQLTFEPGKEVPRETLLAALRQKYGQETRTNGTGYDWFTDAGGGHPDAGKLGTCGRGWNEEIIRSSDPITRTFAIGDSLLLDRLHNDRLCDSMMHVRAILRPSPNRGDAYIHEFIVSVTDNVLALRASKLTFAAVDAADARNNQRERAQPQPGAPKL